MGKETYQAVVTDHIFDPLDIERNELQQCGIEMIAAQCRWDNEQEIIEKAKQAHALIVQNAIITRKVIESLERCQVISFRIIMLEITL